MHEKPTKHQNRRQKNRTHKRTNLYGKENCFYENKFYAKNLDHCWLVRKRITYSHTKCSTKNDTNGLWNEWQHQCYGQNKAQSKRFQRLCCHQIRYHNVNKYANELQWKVGKCQCAIVCSPRIPSVEMFSGHNRQLKRNCKWNKNLIETILKIGWTNVIVMTHVHISVIVQFDVNMMKINVKKI